MNIQPIRSYIPVNTRLRKVLPAAIAVSTVTAPALTSCNIDNRQHNHKVDWFAVEFNRLSDEDVRKINKTRQAPQNTVFAKIDETKTEYYTDSEGNRRSREVKPADGIMSLLTTEAEWKPAQQLFLKDLVLKKMLWASFM